MSDKISIPEKHQEFCRVVARICREYGLNNFSGKFTPGFRDEWGEEIQFSWEQGRHGEDSQNICITSTCFIRTTIQSAKTEEAKPDEQR